MTVWLMYPFVAVIVVLGTTAVFFFTLTRGALLMRQMSRDDRGDTAHVYPLYTDMRLIRMIDFQPLISAILLFQYHWLVSAIVHDLRKADLRGKEVLMTSCAFGNVVPRVVAAAIEGNAKQILIADIVENQLQNAERKLLAHTQKLKLLQGNAIYMALPDGSVAANIIFFLLHELPHTAKELALREAVRVLEPGGKLYLADFHRPEPRALRTLSWIYFKVFEPLGLALWDTHDPLRMLETMGGLTCERRTCFFGNFQVLVASKNPG